MASALSAWKQKFIAVASGLGAPGLFLISYVDSSFFTFPIVNDLLLVELAILHPSRMPLYAFLAALGSLLGCITVYFIARKGGEAFFRKHAGPRADAIRRWMARNGFVAVFAAAMLPPPTPFKIFVIAAGVFRVSFPSFVSAIALARLLRYFVIGYLAVRYGADALPFLQQHKWQTGIVVLVLVAASYALSRLILRSKPGEQPAESGR